MLAAATRINVYNIIIYRSNSPLRVCRPRRRFIYRTRAPAVLRLLTYSRRAEP